MKVINVAKAFLYLESQNEGEGVTNLKLQKLVYYAQGFFLAIYGRTLFDEEIEAWTHGPVVPELYQFCKQYGKKAIPEDHDFLYENMGQEEKAHISDIYEEFGRFAAWALRNMTHEEPPWQNHHEGNEVIPTDELESYFKTRLA